MIAVTLLDTETLNASEPWFKTLLKVRCDQVNAAVAYASAASDESTCPSDLFGKLYSTRVTFQKSILLINHYDSEKNFN